ncbi:hypothetical protein L1049_024319 [Liquidambar formosana]|uniref:Uncharacterized protein n=1 Tax=Liquidambar formosana TaxID=63359 RepID=A0AAP0RVW4_LIQFO
MGRRPCCAKVGVKKRILVLYGRSTPHKLRPEPWRRRLENPSSKSRLRWFNYLKPGIKRGHISMDEEDLIIRLHNLLGNRWSLIAGRLPGRTDNEIKNYWNTTLFKKLNSQPSPPSIIQLESKDKKTVQKLCTSYSSSCIHNGHASTSSCPALDSDSLNFLMDFNIDEVLIQDVLNPNFSQFHYDDMNGNGNMADGANTHASSMDCPISKDEMTLENGMECDPIQPTLELELIKTTGFFSGLRR